MTRANYRIIFIQTKWCWDHWMTFLKFNIIFNELLHGFSRFHFSHLIMFYDRMFLTKLILLVFLVLVFFWFRDYPCRAFWLSIIIIRIIIKLSFGSFNIKSKVSSFFSGYRFKKVILIGFIFCFSWRWLVSLRFLVIRIAFKI